MQFGNKVRFKKTDYLSEKLESKEYCLVALAHNAFMLVEWKDRGSFDLLRFSGSPEVMLEKLPESCL